MTATTPRRGPLARFRVIDLTRVRSGPTCVRQFADWGADVIKIETPPGLNMSDGWGGNRNGADFQNLHRNKRGFTLNLKDADGLKIFNQLVERSDVVAENYRPDVKFRLGIDYESLKKINKKIVLASISGFGQSGPYAKRPGFDQVTQGMGGLMAITGEPGKGPMRAGCAVSDSAAGLYLATGVLTALLEREVSGEGQWVEVSLLNAMIALLDFQAARWTFAHEIPEQAGNDHPTSIPTGVFQTADGYMNIAAAGDEMYARVCKALSVEQLIDLPEYKTGPARSKNRAALNKLLQDEMIKQSSAYWEKSFEALGVAGGPIYKMDQVFADPQVQYNQMAAPIHHPTLGDVALVNQPFRLSRTPHEIRCITPDCGEHTDEILHELGYQDGQIADLRQRNVV